MPKGWVMVDVPWGYSLIKGNKSNVNEKTHKGSVGKHEHDFYVESNWQEEKIEHPNWVLGTSNNDKSVYLNWKLSTSNMKLNVAQTHEMFLKKTAENYGAGMYVELWVYIGIN